ncbi:chloride channel protein [Niastella yeongjuensis]|uniref:Chloride channel protein n=1 Tax=Niastella yeongjuensis TaxID=354355 RepID=A0A1V9EL23_9BACT|nr:chloride channel protein [Niastella yeongjuensis]OQP46843.1 chloride channel protein [Niastella yeongjuensis]SEN56814.1 H+/Cl-antiporter ClcA [Niastella yeongjuensis]
MDHTAKHSHNRIPISVSLDETMSLNDMNQAQAGNKKRLAVMSGFAVAVAVCISFIAKGLVYLINIFTNLAFHHTWSIEPGNPGSHHYGLFVIIIPAIGGLIVGLMALYGSKAIRGHGIPEAMEQILTNNSKIRPSITYLKPLSSAISIGTGGPFGAEGPIIATGGALGSTIGQLFRISAYERKILLTAGATAGMSAIFGSPVAAIFLAIELLLFEFSPRSIIPVALACITGAAGHHLLFESGPVFPSPVLEAPSNMALITYSIIGIAIGLLAAGVTKIVYLIEDAFEKLPIHWAWWPAIGGLAVGLVGYFAPYTLGVGYENITHVLSGQMTLQLIVSLAVMKFISWAIALGSGTSGGTLAPLLTIGGATGAALGIGAMAIFPQAGISVSMAALIGMSAMFAGASRALLTSIIFAIETTGQENALLPLLAGCIAAYIVSYFLMEHTIMTEKIARRGVKTPDIYQPDVLEKITVEQVLSDATVIEGHTSIKEVRSWLEQQKEQQRNYYIVVNNEGIFKGIVSASNLFSMHHEISQPIETLIKRKATVISPRNTLKAAVQLMASENVDVLPVVDRANNSVLGVLSYTDVLSGYRQMAEEGQGTITISLKRRTLKMLVHGKKGMAVLKPTSKKEADV